MRKTKLTPAHKYMFEILADRLSLEIPVIEDFILDSSSVSSYCKTFCLRAISLI